MSEVSNLMNTWKQSLERTLTT